MSDGEYRTALLQAAYRERDAALAKLAEVEKKYERLRWGVVANAGRLTRTRKMVRWAHVADATGFGSTSSAELCAESGFDPDGFYGTESKGPTL